MSDRLDAANRQERPEVLTEQQVAGIRLIAEERARVVWRPEVSAVELARSHEALRSRCADLERALEWIGEFAKAHHADQESHVFLHALTIDIPSYVEEALAAAPTREEKPGA